MTLADSSTHCLAGLITSTILHDHILVRASPSLFLIASGLEDALIGKDEVATIFDDLVYLVSKLDGQVGVLLVELVLLLRLVLGLHLLELEAVELEDSAVVPRLDDVVRELPMEEPRSLGEAQMRLSMHRLRIEDEVQLLLGHRCKGHSL